MYLLHTTILLYIFIKMKEIIEIDSKRAEKLKKGAVCQNTGDVLYKVVHDPTVNEAMKDLDQKDSLDSKWSILLWDIQCALQWDIKDKAQLVEIIDLLKSDNVRWSENLSDAIRKYLKWSENNESNEKTSYKDLKNPEIRNFIREFWGERWSFNISKLCDTIINEIYNINIDTLWDDETIPEMDDTKQIELAKVYFKNPDIIKLNFSSPLDANNTRLLYIIEEKGWEKNIMLANWRNLTNKIKDTEGKEHKIVSIWKHKEKFFISIKNDSGEYLKNYLPIILENNIPTVQASIDIIWKKWEKIGTKKVISIEEAVKIVEENTKKENGEWYIQETEEEKTPEKKSFLAGFFSKK